MCIAICSSTGKRPSEKIIDDCYESNPDGAGIAWPVGNKIRWKKGLDLPGIKAALAAIPENTSFIMHFRIASVGPKVPELTHPFPLTPDCSIALEGEAEAVLFQNGTYSSWEDKLIMAAGAKGFELPPPPWSDSRALAVVSHAFGPNVLYLINNASRFAVLTAGKTPNARRIKLIGDWSEQDGIHYSNRFCEPFVPATPRSTFTPAHTQNVSVTSSATTTTTSGTNGSGSVLRRPSAQHIGPPREFNTWEVFDSSGLEVRGATE